MEIKVLFFGILASVSGTNIRHYRDVRSVGDLRLRIYDDFPEIVHYDFCISVNSNITDNDTLLNPEDEVALIPPFAGR